MQPKLVLSTYGHSCLMGAARNLNVPQLSWVKLSPPTQVVPSDGWGVWAILPYGCSGEYARPQPTFARLRQSPWFHHLKALPSALSVWPRLGIYTMSTHLRQAVAVSVVLSSQGATQCSYVWPRLGIYTTSTNLRQDVAVSVTSLPQGALQRSCVWAQRGICTTSTDQRQAAPVPVAPVTAAFYFYIKSSDTLSCFNFHSAN